MRWVVPLLVCAAGCRFDLPETEEASGGGSVRVGGRLVDLVTGQPVSGTASVTTSGLAASPTIEVQGSTFMLDGIPENSVFHVQAAVPPSHHATSSAIEVLAADLDEVAVPVVGEAFLAQVASSFGVTPAATRGMLFAQLVGASGQPRAGIMTSSFVVDGGAATKGPFFLDATLAPAPGATMTSASGWVVYFDLASGIIAVRATQTASVTFDMPDSPVNPGVVTVARVQTTDGMFVPPANVSYSQQVFPIFAARGCPRVMPRGMDRGASKGT